MNGKILWRIGWIFFLVLAWLAVHSTTHASDQDNHLLYLKNLSIAQLSSLEVTSVSKTEEKMSDADAAIYVITQEDIRRSGLTSIPELLRMVPGLQVAHIDGNKWAISARGFNAWYSDKLLVLMDGRSIYTPLFSGVNWNMQDTFLDDIDRIEVIRGPGATLWGANAVNGVINIITKKAQDTQGGLVKAGGGNLEQGFGGARYGGTIGEKGWYRVYAKYFNRASFKTRSGHDANDDWKMGRCGFRMDFYPSLNNEFTLEGDLFAGQSSSFLAFTPPGRSVPFDEISEDQNGGDIIGSFRHHFSETSDLKIQFYFDRTHRHNPYIKETRNNFDLDIQHSFVAFKRHHLIWGLEYRLTHDNLPRTEVFFFDPESRTDNLFSGFLQDRISIIDQTLDVTLGTKLEHNDYSGFEVQPSFRIRYKPTVHQLLWAAISRAVRTPSRADHDMNFTLQTFNVGPIQNVVLLKGNDDLDSEKLLAYEAGYRFAPGRRYSLDIALFYNVYRDLRTNRMGEPTQIPSLYASPNIRIIPLNIINQYHEDSYGLEISSQIGVTQWWKLSLSYSWLKLRLHTSQQVNDIELKEDNIPRNQFSIRSYMDLPANIQFDAMLFHVDALNGLDVPGYTRLDMRLGWNPIKNLSLSLKLQNLLDNRHQEFGSIGALRASEVPRSFYGKLTWQF